jgi:DNA-binding CsgD family transcriptional regulator
MTNTPLIVNRQELEFSQALGLKLQELTREFLTLFQLSHAFVGKDYFDGQFFNISSDLPWKKITAECDYHKDFTKKYLSNIKVTSEKSLLFMWERDSGNPTPVLDHIYSHSGATSGFNILIPKGDHFENYGFASTKPLAEVYNNLPSREAIEMFCLYLQDELLHSPSLNRPAFGYTGQHINPIQGDDGQIPIPKAFSFTCNQRGVRITRQELLCLGLLARGYDLKDIARLLSISPRTVEFHLNQIKLKCDMPSKSQLLTSFNRSLLGRMDPFRLMKMGKRS